MNEQTEWPAQRFYGWRQRSFGRRLVIVVVVVLLLGSGLYFTLRLPVVQRISGGVILFAQTLRTHFEQIATTYFGREVLLRQRTRHLLQQLDNEIERLHWLEVESTTMAVMLALTSVLITPSFCASAYSTKANSPPCIISSARSKAS